MATNFPLTSRQAEAEKATQDMRREFVQLERSLLLARDKAREAEGEARQLREHGAAGGCGAARE